MKAKSISGIILLLFGIAGLIIGLLGVFGQNITEQNPWFFTILGFLFFTSGIGLLKNA